MRYLSTNQTQVFTPILASTFRRLRHILFLLRVLRNSSSQPQRVLEFHVNTSWPWHPGASLLSRPKCSSYHLCRLQGQIGWHALTFESGISPLCLQISFCINIKYKGYLDHVELHIINSYSRFNTRLTSSQTCHMLPLHQSNIEAIVVSYIHQNLLIFMNEPICHANMSTCSNHVLSKVWMLCQPTLPCFVGGVACHI